MECVCQICLGYLINPRTCENGHDICINCTARTERCPFCRSPRRRANLDLRRRMDELTDVRCLHADCGVVGRLFAMDNHLRHCEFRRVDCPKTDCRWCDEYKLLADHVLQTHSDAVKSENNTLHDEYFARVEKYLLHVEVDLSVRDNYVFRFRCVNDVDFTVDRIVVMCLETLAFATRRYVDYLEVSVDRYAYDRCPTAERGLRIC